MTAEAPTADLAFTRLRERTVAAGQRWEIHGADEPWRRSIMAFRQ
jgi:hypothetical protein